MKVFKFGGASIKDASSIKNILEIISNYSNDNLLIVVSAMGKTTNALEKVVENYFKNKSELKSSILEVLNFHIDICNELFPKNHLIFSDINSIFRKINTFINSNKSSGEVIICAVFVFMSWLHPPYPFFTMEFGNAITSLE